MSVLSDCGWIEDCERGLDLGGFGCFVEGKVGCRAVSLGAGLGGWVSIK